MTYRSSAHDRDRETLTVCLMAVAATALSKEISVAEISAVLRRRLGIGWTIMSALQWLTGSKGRACVEAMSDTEQVEGINKTAARALVDFAQRCIDAHIELNAPDAGKQLAGLRELVARTSTK